MFKKAIRIWVAIVALLGGISSVPGARADDMSNYTFVHDPSMIKEGHAYLLEIR